MVSTQLITSVAKNTGSLVAGLAGAYSVTLTVQGAVHGFHLLKAMHAKSQLTGQDKENFSVGKNSRVVLDDSVVDEVRKQTLYATQMRPVKKTALIAAGAFATSVVLLKACGIPSFTGRVLSYLPVTLNPNVLKSLRLA